MHDPHPPMIDADPPAFIPPGHARADGATRPAQPGLAANAPPMLQDLAFIPPGLWLAYLDRLASSTLRRAA